MFNDSITGHSKFTIWVAPLVMVLVAWKSLILVLVSNPITPAPSLVSRMDVSLRPGISKFTPGGHR